MEKENITDKINAFDITSSFQIEIIFDENDDINQESKGDVEQICNPLQNKNSEDKSSPKNSFKNNQESKVDSEPIRTPLQNKYPENERSSRRNLKNDETQLIVDIEGSKNDGCRKDQDQHSLSGPINKLQPDKFNTILSIEDSDKLKRNSLKQCKQGEIDQQSKSLDDKSATVQNNCEIPTTTKTNPFNNYENVYDIANVNINAKSHENAGSPKSNDKSPKDPKRNSDDTCHKKRKLNSHSSEIEKGINTKIFREDNNTMQSININDKEMHALENSIDQNSSRLAVLEFYVKRLLRSVMVNLIKIDQAYSIYEYAKISMPGNHIEIDKLRLNYRNLKFKLFHLSYHIAENVILPQQNNVAFIRSFLNDIIELGNSSNGYKCSYRRIEYLLKELIAWTTLTINRRLEHEKAPILNNVILPVRDERTNYVHCHQQRGISVNTNMTTTTNNTTVIQPFENFTNPNERVLFSYGPQERQIKISVPSLDKSSTSVNSNPSIQNMGHINSYPCAQKTISHSSSSVNSIQSNQLHAPNFNVNNAILADLLSQNRQLDSNYSSNTITQVFVRKPPPWAPPPPYESRPNIDLTNQVSDSTNNENHNKTSNRSLSTDSGFVSPIHFSPPADKMDNQLPINSHNVQTANKRVRNPENICYICGVTTRNLCKRCYGRYYCSVVCQNIDWPSHSLVCKEVKK